MYCSVEDTLEYAILDEIFVKYESDKSSHHHDYSKIYSRFFSPIKKNKLKFLEIGISTGSSVKAWEEYFPNAELHFIDLKKVENTSDRSQFYFLDQGNPDLLGAFAEIAGDDFDIIIDDGGHTSEQQITSFEVLFPYLKSGGIYVIEDLSFCRDNYKDGLTTFEFLKQLIDEINYTSTTWTGRAKNSVETLPKHIQAQLNLYRKDIDWMIIQPNLALLTKK